MRKLWLSISLVDPWPTKLSHFHIYDGMKNTELLGKKYSNYESVL